MNLSRRRSRPAARRPTAGADFLVSLAAGALLGLLFLPSSWAWLAPIPVAVALAHISGAATPRAAFAAGFAGGLGFLAVHLAWLPTSFGRLFGRAGAVVALARGAARPALLVGGLLATAGAYGLTRPIPPAPDRMALSGATSLRSQSSRRPRAIENRRYVVRASNDGIGAAIDPLGRVIVRFPEGGPGAFRSRYALADSLSPYVRLGDWPVLLFALVLATVILSAPLAARAHPRSHRVP